MLEALKFPIATKDKRACYIKIFIWSVDMTGTSLIKIITLRSLQVLLSQTIPLWGWPLEVTSMPTIHHHNNTNSPTWSHSHQPSTIGWSPGRWEARSFQVDMTRQWACNSTGAILGTTLHLKWATSSRLLPTIYSLRKLVQFQPNKLAAYRKKVIKKQSEESKEDKKEYQQILNKTNKHAKRYKEQIMKVKAQVPIKSQVHHPRIRPLTCFNKESKMNNIDNRPKTHRIKNRISCSMMKMESTDMWITKTSFLMILMVIFMEKRITYSQIRNWTFRDPVTAC